MAANSSAVLSLDDSGVQQIINHRLDHRWASDAREPCCGGVHAAWAPTLVNQRRVPGASLNCKFWRQPHITCLRAITYAQPKQPHGR